MFAFSKFEKLDSHFFAKSQQPIKGIRFGANIAGAIINFIQYYTPITTFALQSSHPLVFQAAWEGIKIKLQPCTLLQPWFMAISHEVVYIKRKTKIVLRWVIFLSGNFFSIMYYCCIHLNYYVDFPFFVMGF